MNRKAEHRFIVITAAAYLIVALGVAYVCRNVLGSVDGVAYLQAAKNYASGRFDLAVTSWWAPLSSWILVPAIWLGLDPLFASKGLLVLLGLVFAFEVASLIRYMGLQQHYHLIFTASLLFYLGIFPTSRIPDLLLLVLLTGYFNRSLRLLYEDRYHYAVTSGFIAGLAYLTKAYALPFVIFHLIVTLLIRRTLRKKTNLRLFLIVLAVLLLVSAPYVVLLSIKEQRFTIGGAAYIRAWVPISGEAPNSYDLSQGPRNGRITSWENPLEIPKQWAVWSPFDSLKSMKHQATISLRNIWASIKFVRSLDLWGIITSSIVFAIILTLLPTNKNLEKTRTFFIWAIVSSGLYTGGYVLILIEPRYLWPIVGLLLPVAIMLSFFIVDCYWIAYSKNAYGTSRQRKKWLHFTRLVMAGVLLLSIALPSIKNIHGSFRDGNFHTELRDFAQASNLKGTIASNSWHQGVYFSYFKGLPFIGQISEHSPKAIAKELKEHGVKQLLIIDDVKLSMALEHNQSFKKVANYSGGTGNWYLFDFSSSKTPAGNEQIQ